MPFQTFSEENSTVENSNEDNPTVKVAGMSGQLMDVIKEVKALHSSYGQEGYCEEVFLSTVQNLAEDVKKSSNSLN